MDLDDLAGIHIANGNRGCGDSGHALLVLRRLLRCEPFALIHQAATRPRGWHGWRSSRSPVAAIVKKGVLTVTLPKTEEASKPGKIEVKAAT
jgi:hypothetical protein